MYSIKTFYFFQGPDPIETEQEDQSTYRFTADGRGDGRDEKSRRCLTITYIFVNFECWHHLFIFNRLLSIHSNLV